MPSATTEATTTIDNPASEETVETTAGDESAHTEGGDPGDEQPGNDADAAGGDAGDPGVEKTPADGADPDADIKAMLREGREPKTPTTDATPPQAKDKAGTDAAAGGDKADKAPEQPAPFAERFEAARKAITDTLDDDSAKALTPLLELVKEQQAEIDRINGVAGQFTGYQQAQQAQVFHGVCDELAANGFDFLGSTKDDTADMEARAQIWADACLVFDTAQRKAAADKTGKTKPISERRAVLFAARQYEQGEKSDKTTKDEQAAERRQTQRSVPPKSTGGAPVKDPSIDPNDPDAEAKAAVRKSLQGMGIKRR